MFVNAWQPRWTQRTCRFSVARDSGHPDRQGYRSRLNRRFRAVPGDLERVSPHGWDKYIEQQFGPRGLTTPGWRRARGIRTLAKTTASGRTLLRPGVDAAAPRAAAGRLSTGHTPMAKREMRTPEQMQMMQGSVVFSPSCPSRRSCEPRTASGSSISLVDFWFNHFNVFRGRARADLPH